MVHFMEQVYKYSIMILKNMKKEEIMFYLFFIMELFIKKNMLSHGMILLT